MFKSLFKSEPLSKLKIESSVRIRVIFNPAKEDENIIWDMEKYDCYKTSVGEHGKCSLFLEKPINNLDAPYRKCEFSLCRDMENDVINNTLGEFLPRVCLKDGKYTLNDGTHRLCIAKQRKVNIPIELLIDKIDLKFFNPEDIIFCETGIYVPTE